MFRRNRIELTGNITKSPRSARVGSGIVVRARLIHNETVERANGETIERLTAVEIEIWGKRGVAFEQHVTPKTPVYIEGTLQREHSHKLTKLLCFDLLIFQAY